MRNPIQISNEEKESIRNSHSSFYNGYATGNVPSNLQPLRVDNSVKDHNGITVDNKGNVKQYTNHRVNEAETNDSDNLNYNVLLGYAMGMSKTLWAEPNKDIDLIGALKELKLYYLDLRNGKTPMVLSVPAQAAKSTVEKLVSELPNESLSSLEKLGASLKTLSESDYKGKNVSLNKPKSGGPKKWYVYVKNPKTGKVIKVSYGSPVMKAKWNDSAARKSFAARHRCHMKKDKTKAGYWACRAHKDFGKNVSGRFW